MPLNVVLEKALESPLDCKEIQPVHPKENQSWIFIGKTDAEAEAPILWPHDVKNWLTGKDPDAVKDWRQEEKGKTENEIVGWHHWLNGHEFEQAPGVGDGQGSLVCCSPWVTKSWTWLSDWTEGYNIQHGKCNYHWCMLKRKGKSLPCVWVFVAQWTYTVHGILQARTLEWVAIPFSRRSSQPGDWTQISHCRWILYRLGCMLYAKIKRVNLKCSHYNEIFFSFSFIFLSVRWWTLTKLIMVIILLCM